jgi:hypothetical protein
LGCSQNVEISSQFDGEVAFTGAYGNTGIFFLPPNATMNVERNQKVLEDHLLPFMGAVPLPCDEENQRVPAEQSLQSSYSNWPGNLPDLKRMPGTSLKANSKART